MDAILKVAPETLLSAASELETEGGTLKSLTEQMVSLIQEISGEVWSGEAAESYKVKFLGLQDSIARIHQMAAEHAQNLSEIAGQFRETESQNQDMAESLISDVIH